MGLKEEELKRAKDTSLKFESELKEISLKHASVIQNTRRRRRTRRKSCFLSGFFFCFRFWRRETHCRNSFKQKQSSLQKLRR